MQRKAMDHVHYVKQVTDLDTNANVIDTPIHCKTEISYAIIYKEYSQEYFQPNIGRK